MSQENSILSVCSESSARERVNDILSKSGCQSLFCLPTQPHACTCTCASKVHVSRHGISFLASFGGKKFCRVCVRACVAKFNKEGSTVGFVKRRQAGRLECVMSPLLCLLQTLTLALLYRFALCETRYLLICRRVHSHYNNGTCMSLTCGGNQMNSIRRVMWSEQLSVCNVKVLAPLGI